MKSIITINKLSEISGVNQGTITRNIQQILDKFAEMDDEVVI